MELIQGLNVHRQICSRLCPIKSDDNLTLVHVVVVTHAQFANYPAGRMLNLFHVRFYDDRSTGDDSASQFGGCCPAADTEHESATQKSSSHQMTANRMPVNS